MADCGWLFINHTRGRRHKILFFYLDLGLKGMAVCELGVEFFMFHFCKVDMREYNG